ncbi:hypothetical protein C0Q70_12499 [Pomacea canaliculata]|uniref:BTB domain-containing protein n=1 Tax=Pomacea canaliculata TaxID=400727 RepID=A0A2T7P1S4_POMCA|nr:hypothetical protein C0Q70_12499 [Pomacea canaliculata]
MTSATLANRAFTNICLGLGQQVDEEDFCDLIVVAGQKEFPCHRAVLASVSSFFKTSLMPCWKESSSGRVEITHEDVSPESFGFLMDIIYKGQNVVRNETAKDILKMSVYLQIRFLEVYCIEFIKEKLEPEKCLGMWMFAEKYDLETLEKESFKMAVDQISVVTQRDEVLTLPLPKLLVLLSEQRKLSMDDICRTILRWVEADQDTRQIYLSELLTFVCFPLLSSVYLCELFTYHSHPFKEILFGYTEVEKPTRDTHAFDLKKNAMKMYILASLPEDIGLDFASCTWNNAIYVSGGSQMRNFFTVYKAEDNEWEVLPSLPDDGREKHAMAAVNSNIYVLGGLMKTSTGEKTISFNVLQFKTSTKEWSIFCQLPLAVQQSAATVLGHRIYLFGGINTTGDGTDIVQCVDTLSGCVYQTGKLPSPTYGARALSNGGRIYVVRPEGDVLSMTESFALAERIEELISEVKNQIDDHWSDPIQSTVSFKELAKLPKVRHFGAYLNAGEIIVCGGETEDRQLLDRFESISLADGTTSTKSLTFITGAAKFDLHLLNIPQAFLKEETAVIQPFRVGDKVMHHEYNKYGSKTRSEICSITEIDYDSMTATIKLPDSRILNYNITDLQHASI